MYHDRSTTGLDHLTEDKESTGLFRESQNAQFRINNLPMSTKEPLQVDVRDSFSAFETAGSRQQRHRTRCNIYSNRGYGMVWYSRV